MKEESSLFKLHIGETLLIAVVPVIGYAVTFSYEYGFINYFDLPAHMIKISLTNMLIAVFSVVVFLFSLIGLQETFNIKPNLSILSMFLVGFVFWPTFDNKTKLTIGILVGTILIFNLAIFLYKKFRNHRNQETKAKTKERLTIKDIVNVKSLTSETLLLTLIIGTYLAYLTGSCVAIRQRDFMLVNTNPESLIIAHYDDYFLLKPINLQNVELSQDAKILSLDDFSNQGLSMRKITIDKLKMN